MDLARAVNEEMHDLAAAGADVIQLDEPYMEARTEQALEYGIDAFNAALDGVQATKAIHICCGYGRSRRLRQWPSASVGRWSTRHPSGCNRHPTADSSILTEM